MQISVKMFVLFQTSSPWISFLLCVRSFNKFDELFNLVLVYVADLGPGLPGRVSVWRVVAGGDGEWCSSCLALITSTASSWLRPGWGGPGRLCTNTWEIDQQVSCQLETSHTRYRYRQYSQPRSCYSILRPGPRTQSYSIKLPRQGQDYSRASFALLQKLISSKRGKEVWASTKMIDRLRLSGWYSSDHQGRSIRPLNCWAWTWY